MAFKEYLADYAVPTDTSFRAWVGALLQGWQDAGWMRANDPGQINPETVNLPATAHTAAGYAMFRLDDDMQDTVPVFFKIEFGCAAIGPGSCRLWLTVGKGTDGTGGINGVLLPRTSLGYSPASTVIASGAFSDLASSGPGYVAFLPQTDNSTGAAVEASTRAKSFLIERSRAADGTPTSGGLMIAYDIFAGSRSLNSSSQRPFVRAINYMDGSYAEGIPPVSVPYSINGTPLGPGTSLAAGSIGPVFPWVLIAPGLAPWQSCIMVCIPSGDYPSGIFETTLCGNAATFRAVPVSMIHTWGVALQPGSSGASGYVGPAIRWEP